MIALLVGATDVFIGGWLGGGRNAFTIVNLATALPYAFLGGRIAAGILRGREMTAAIGLSVVTVLFSVISLWIDRGRQPLWYWGLLLVLCAAGAFLGAYLRFRAASGSNRPPR